MAQEIQITLLTVGPGHYGSPHISSPAIHFEGVAYPKEQIPAGPTQVYRFRAVARGEALINVPHVNPVAYSSGGEIRDPHPDFAIIIRVH